MNRKKNNQFFFGFVLFIYGLVSVFALSDLADVDVLDDILSSPLQNSMHTSEIIIIAANRK